ncbi:MAG: SGNH/GDSL hydrolase family protein [Planctomycetes bacterium]|nr:SGNH/GDSL hydrolase family protein [Planctomycetota bacterium]
MFLSAAFVAFTLAAPPAPFELKDGDRIVWLGNTLVEREQRYGYWETALLAANADKKITVRNLGWSGDTVFGEARGRFDFNDPAKCFKQLVDQTLALEPTVIFISYGTNESFEGKDGLPKFEKGLEKLLDAMKPTKARIVLFSPIPVDPSDTRAGYKGAEARNADLKLYSDAIAKIAQNRDHRFADLYTPIMQTFAGWKTHRSTNPHLPEAEKYLTENSMHLTQHGYGLTVLDFLKSLGLDLEVSAAEKTGVLRQAILAKNEQFFNKWRPQNETYLFGFRKHEQGRNAKEIAEFDPFIAKAEDEIEKLRKELKK